MEVLTEGKSLVICPTARHPEADVMEWERALEWAIEQGPETLIFDCSHLDLLTSMGLVFFLSTHTRAQEAGVTFRICNLRDTVAESVESARLHRVLEIYPSLESALAG